MKIIKLDQIKEILKKIDIISVIEQGFIAYSNGNVISPPVGEMIFQQPPGDVHIKYGYIAENEYYVVKIASGFYDNPILNLPSSNGLMLIFSQKTGEILGILLDECYLTNIRTAAAGAIVAKFLAPSKINKIGIVGTGAQARMQLDFLQKVIQCKEVMIFGRDKNKLLSFQTDMEKNFKIRIANTIKDITDSCELIVTTTPATSPFLFSDMVRRGTHITAIGADTAQKQEVDTSIFEMADIIVADSIAECAERGDISYAIREKVIDKTKIIELGNIISNKCKGRINNEQITIADLTGLAVQDIQIAKAIFTAIS